MDSNNNIKLNDMDKEKAMQILKEQGITDIPEWATAWLSCKEVAMTLAPVYSLNRIYREVKSGKLPFAGVKMGKMWFFKREDVEAFKKRMLDNTTKC